MSKVYKSYGRAQRERDILAFRPACSYLKSAVLRCVTRCGVLIKTHVYVGNSGAVHDTLNGAVVSSVG